MTIQLPDELETSIEAAVRSGRFRSAEELVAEAIRSLLQPPAASLANSGPDPFLGSMRDDADQMDAIVADVYRQRGEETWREFNLE